MAHSIEEQVRAVLEKLIAAHARKEEASYAASACGTSSDFSRLHRRIGEFEDAMDEAVAEIVKEIESRRRAA